MERENSKVWFLACHACIETKQEYASEIAKEIIGSDPANHGVVTWALHRGYEFDLQAVFSALQKRLLQEPDNIEIYLATWSLTFSLKDDRASEDLVDASEEAFRRTGNADLWLFHKIQFLTARNDLIGTENLIPQIKDEHLRRDAQLNQLRRQAQTRNELLGELACRIQEEYQISGNAKLLMECCDLKLHIDEFAYVSEHSDLLITSIGTAPALRLALEGTYKNGDFQQCLSLITNFQHLFRDGVISPDIRQLRALCMHKLGDWSEAISEAERIYAEFPDIHNFISLFDLLVKTGDTRRCSSLARDLLIIKGADSSQLLTATSFIHVHDLELARSLWRAATQTPIKKANLSLRLRAMELAYTLGLSREANDLLNSLVEAAQKGKGPLKMKTFEETLQLFREQREINEKNSKLYMQGSVPIHLLVEFLNMPMVQLFHQQAFANREDRNLLKSTIIFGRSGNRPVENLSPKCIIADITGIIMMADLNLLEEVEVALEPIYISPAVTISLMEQIRKVTPNQPDRCESRETFCRLVKTGRIATVEVPSEWTYISSDLRERIGTEASALLEIAVKEGGVLISDGLVNDLSSPFMPAPLPPEVAERVRQTVEFTNYLQPSIHPVIFPFSEGSLVLVPHIVVAGLSSQSWETASQCFRLAVLPESLEHLEKEVQADQNAESLARWTQSLLDRLQRGIARGIYRILPAAKQPKNDEKWGTDSRSLADILAYHHPQGGVVWCDDRMLNRHLLTNSARIVGISEILKLLRKKGLTDASYFDAIIHLRRSNIRYIPISPEEIIYHLKLSELKEGRIAENSRLATIRRYLNATLLDKEWLQPPLLLEEGTKDMREYVYPLGLFRSVDEAIFLIWKEGGELKLTEARADWLLNNLHIDIIGFRQCLNTGCNADEVRTSLGAMVGMLYVKGVALPRLETDSNYSPRRAYFGWLTERLLKSVISSNPSLLNLVCENISNSIQDQLKLKRHQKKQHYRDAKHTLVAGLIYDLPHIIAEKMKFPEDTLELLGLTVSSIVKIGNQTYNSDHYWECVASAVNNCPSDLSDQSGNQVLNFSLNSDDDDSKLVVVIKDEKNNEIGRLNDKALPIFLDSVEKRIECLRENREWFDRGAEQIQSAISIMASIESPSERMEAVMNVRKESVAVAYRRITKILNQPKVQFKLDDFRLPSLERILMFIRLEIGETAESSDEALSRSAIELLQDEGLATAIERHICLPCKLPDLIEELWAEISDAEAREMFERLNGSPHSLIADLHLVRLAGLRNTLAFWKLANDLVLQLMDFERSHATYHDFHALLEFSDEEFSKLPSGMNLPPWCRFICIWYHASRLHGLLRNVELNSTSLSIWIKRQLKSWNNNTLRHSQDSDIDVAEPANLCLGWVTLHGLASLIGDLPGISNLVTLTPLVAPFIGADTLTRFELYRRRDCYENSLSSFIGGASDEQLTSLYGEENLHSGFGMLADESFASYVEQLSSEQHDPNIWFILDSIVGQGRVPNALSGRLLEVIQSYKFDELVLKSPAMGMNALVFSSRHLSRCLDQKLVEEMVEKIFICAGKLDAADIPEKFFFDEWGQLGHALLLLARSSDGEEKCSTRYFGYMQRLLTVCPKITPNIATDWLSFLPVEQQTNIWPFIFTARAIR